MAPKTINQHNNNDDRAFFENNNNIMISFPSSTSNGMRLISSGFWEGGANTASSVKKAEVNNNISPSQVNKTMTTNTTKHYVQSEIPYIVTMDSTVTGEAPTFSEAPTTPDWEDEEHYFSFGNVKQCFSSPLEHYENDDTTEPIFWNEIKQSYTSPPVKVQNPFDFVTVDSSSKSKQESKTTYSPSVSTSAFASPTSATIKSFDLASPSGLEPLLSSVPQKSIEFPSESLVLAKSVVTTKTTSTAIVSVAPQKKNQNDAEIKRGNNNHTQNALIATAKVATSSKALVLSSPSAGELRKTLHPWSNQTEVTNTVEKEKEPEVDMDTYRQGLQGHHGQPIKAGLAVGYTNANYANDETMIQTKLPICCHKDLDKKKQQEKIERTRQILAEKQQRRNKPQQKCKGMRAIVGNPKALQPSKQETQARSSTVPIRPNNVTKSTRKDAFKILFSNPKPLQKRPTTASKSSFV